MNIERNNQHEEKNKPEGAGITIELNKIRMEIRERL